MTLRSIALSLLFLSFAAAAATAAPVHAAQGEAPVAASDSVKKTVDLKAEQQRLSAELQTLTQQLSDIKRQLESGDNDEARERLADTERRVKSLEKKLAKLQARIDAGDTVAELDDAEDEEMWDEGDFEFGEDWTLADGNVDDDEDQFSFKPDLYRKIPGAFTIPFPLATGFAETIFRYNRVDGVYIGLAKPKRLYWHSQPHLVGSGSLGYGFANHRWRYSLGLYLPFYFDNMIVDFGGEGHSVTDSKDQWAVDLEENTGMAFFAREDFMDYFNREGFSVSASWAYKGPESLNLRASAAYLHDTYDNLRRYTNWSLFGGDKVFRPQPWINRGNINSLIFNVSASTTTPTSSSAHGWTATAAYEMAGGATKGDYEFTQVTIDVRRYQPLRDFLNLNVRGRIVLSDGDVPVQRAVELGGLGTLPGYRFKEFGGTNAAIVNAELIFRNTLFEESSDWVARAVTSINLILFADAGVVSDAALVSGAADFRTGLLDASFSDTFLSRQWKSDFGVAIGNADGNFRIGVAWPMVKTAFSEDARFVLRFSRPF
ncbi:MAG: BamA/TamA family outer membrane protein [Ignavibacteriae bacterium]|nr:BamA/TamA family outer membrane protein [Ignavibacteriota bacterium]